MVTVILFTCVFLLVVVYCILGTVAAIRLSNHIGYSDGYLKLWNVTQLAVMSFGKLDYVINDDEGLRLFLKLKKLILIFYSIFLPLAVITFVAQFSGF